MRLFALVTGLLLAVTAPAEAAWKEYVYEDLGIAKYFPAEPKRETGTWGQGIRLPLAKIVPATILTAEDGGVIYKLTVVDFPDREHAKVILDMLERMHHAHRVKLVDAALVTKDDQGKLQIEETKELTTRKGARRGAVIIQMPASS